MKRTPAASPNARLCSRLDEIDFQLQILRQRKTALESYYGTTKGISSKRDERLARVDSLLAELEAERGHYVPAVPSPADTKKQKSAAFSSTKARKTITGGGGCHVFDAEAFSHDVVAALKLYVDGVVSDSLATWAFGTLFDHHPMSSIAIPYRSVISSSDVEFFVWMIVNLQDTDVTHACLGNAAFPLDFIAPVLAHSVKEVVGSISLSLFSGIFKRAVCHAHRAAADSICSAVRESVLVEFLNEEDYENDKSENQILFQQLLKLGWTDLPERLLLLSDKVRDDILIPCSVQPILRLMTSASKEGGCIFSPPSLIPSYIGFTAAYLSPHSIRLSPEPDNTSACLTHLNVRSDAPFIWGTTNTFSLELPVGTLRNDFAFFRVGFVLQGFSPLGECSADRPLLGSSDSIAFSIIPHHEQSVLTSHFNAPSSALRAASASGALRSQSHSRRGVPAASSLQSSNFRLRASSIWSASCDDNTSCSRKFVILKHCNGVTQHLSDPPVLLQLPDDEYKLKFTVSINSHSGSVSLQVLDTTFFGVFDNDVVNYPSEISNGRKSQNFFRGVWFPAASLPIPDTAPYLAEFNFSAHPEMAVTAKYQKGSYLLRTVVVATLNRAGMSQDLNMTAKRVLNRKESVGADVLIPLIFDVDKVSEDHSLEFLAQRSHQLSPESAKFFFPGNDGCEDMRYFVRRLPMCVCSPLVAAIHLRLYNDAFFLVSASPLISIDIPDDFGNTPLILSVLHGQFALARYLVFERCASLTPANASGFNALHVAMQNGQLDILHMLLEHPTAVSAEIVNAATPSGSNCISLCVKLHLFDFLPQLLSRGGNPVLADSQIVSPVLFCLRHRLVAQVKLLLSYCTRSHWTELNLKEKAAPRGTCALYAATVGDLDICQQLEALDVSITATFDNNFNILHAAVIGNISQNCFSTILAQAVKRKVNVNAAEKRNYKTPLHYALELGRIDMAAELVKAGADVNVETKQGLSSLSLGILFGTEKSALEFFYVSRRSGLRVDASDRQGFTPLHHAARKGYCALISTLIELGKADINVTAGGETPIMTAVAYGHVEAAEAILNIANRRIELHSLRSNISTLVQSAFDMGMFRFCRALIAAGAESAPELTAAIRRKPQHDEVVTEFVRLDSPLPDDRRHLAFLTPECAVCAAGSFFSLVTKKASGDNIGRSRMIASFFGEDGNPSSDVYFDICLHLVKHFGTLGMAIHQLQYSSLSPSTSPRSSPRTRNLESVGVRSPTELSLESSSPSSPSRRDVVTVLTEIFHGFIHSVVDAPSLRVHAETVTNMLQAAYFRCEDTSNDPTSPIGWDVHLPFPTAMFFHLIRSGCVDEKAYLDIIDGNGYSREFSVDARAVSKKDGYTLLETSAECGNAIATAVLLEHGAALVTERDADHLDGVNTNSHMPRSMRCAIRGRSKAVAAAFIDQMRKRPWDLAASFSKADFPQFLTIALASDLFSQCNDELEQFVRSQCHFLVTSDPFLMLPPLGAAVAWGRSTFVTRVVELLSPQDVVSSLVYMDMPDLAQIDSFYHEVNIGATPLTKINPACAKSLVNVGIFRCAGAVPSLLRKGFPSAAGFARVASVSGTPPPPTVLSPTLSPGKSSSILQPVPPQPSKPLSSPSAKRSRSAVKKAKEDGFVLDDTDIPIHVALKRLRGVAKEAAAGRGILFHESSVFDVNHISKLEFHRMHSSQTVSKERVELEELVAFMCLNPTVPMQARAKNTSAQNILHLAASSGSPRAFQACFQHFTDELTVFHDELAEINSSKGLPTPSISQLRSLELLEKDADNFSPVDYFIRSRCFHSDVVMLLLDGLVSAKEKYSLLEKVYRELNPAQLAEMIFAHNAQQFLPCSLDASGTGSSASEAQSLASVCARFFGRPETSIWFGMASLCVTGKETQRSNIARKITALPSKTNFLLLCPTFLATLVLSSSYFATQVAVDPSLNPLTRLTKNSLRNSVSLKSALVSFGILLTDQESDVKLAQSAAERYAFNLFVPIPDSRTHATFAETTSYLWTLQGRQLAGPNAPVLPNHLSIDALAGFFLQTVSGLGQLLDKNPRQEAARATNAATSPQSSHVSPAMQQRRLTEELFPNWVQDIVIAACRCGMVFVLASLRHFMLTIPGSDPEKRIVSSVLLASSSAFTAAAFKRHEVLQYLLSLGISPTLQDESSAPMTLLDVVISHVSDDSIAPLQQACRGCVIVLLSSRAIVSPAAVNFFVEHPKIFDVNSQTPVFRDTLLHIAALHSSIAVVEVLLNSPAFVAANVLNKFELVAYEYITEKRLIEPIGRLMLYSAAMHMRSGIRSSSRSRNDDEPSIISERRPTFSDTDAGVPLVQFRVAIASKRTFLRRKSTRVGGAADVIPMHCISPILRGPFLSEGETVDGRFTTFHSEMAVMKISMPLALIIHHLIVFSEGSAIQQNVAAQLPVSQQSGVGQLSPGSTEQVEVDRNPFLALRLSQGQILQLQQCKSSRNASASTRASEPVELIQLTDIQKELIVAAVVQNVLGDAVLISPGDLIVDNDAVPRDVGSPRDRASSIASFGDEGSPSASGFGSIAPSKPSAVVCLIPMYSMKKLI